MNCKKCYDTVGSFASHLARRNLNNSHRTMIENEREISTDLENQGIENLHSECENENPYAAHCKGDIGGVKIAN